MRIGAHVFKFLASHAVFAALRFVTGLASGIIGIGGGLVMNSYMGACTDMSQHEIVSSSLAVAAPIGMSGSLVHYSAGGINVRACGVIAVSTCAAMGAASRFIDQIDDGQLKRIFAVVLANLVTEHDEVEARPFSGRSSYLSRLTCPMATT